MVLEMLERDKRGAMVFGRIVVADDGHSFS